ncbi:MAG: 16S rRNA (guanine(527)-N(7))-methyltransferase RsmG [Lachnospiraceae bacterium]|jgi:16S rRNA (guanine527-N7)-methyltransferase|nr:16S rRNA (guanine(527)-N(7))-methyltransferase RsmG [Lachnospiraceae bacterium]
MEYNEFVKQMEKHLEQLNMVLDEEKIKKFYTYMNILISENEKVNLTAITEPREIVLKHFIDSITICSLIKEEDRIIDVGTGAGFPGIPLKIVDNTINVTLLDSLNKRINFLNLVINKLELKNIGTIHSRAEDAGNNKEYREKYDVAVSRAVAPLPVLLEYMVPLVKQKGKIICMKGPNSKQEIEDAKEAIKVLGAEIEDIKEIKLPFSDIERTIIIINKSKNTPKEYPRKAGIPTKNPIN